MNWTLFKREIKSNYIMLLIFMTVLTMYGIIIVTMFDPKFSEGLKEMAKNMKGVFAMVGMASFGINLSEFLVNLLYGFIAIVFPSIYIIMLANRLIARYVDKGSMAYLLATPNKRRDIITTQAVFMIVNMVILTVYFTVLLIVTSEIMFKGQLDIPKFIMVNAGLLGLFIFLSGICFLCSAVFNETKLSYGVGSGIVIASILIQMLAQANNRLSDLKYATPLTLFNAKGILAGQTEALWQGAILYAAGFVLIGIGINVFCSKDLHI